MTQSAPNEGEATEEDDDDDEGLKKPVFHKDLAVAAERPPSPAYAGGHQGCPDPCGVVWCGVVWCGGVWSRVV